MRSRRDTGTRGWPLACALVACLWAGPAAAGTLADRVSGGSLDGTLTLSGDSTSGVRFEAGAWGSLGLLPPVDGPGPASTGTLHFEGGAAPVADREVLVDAVSAGRRDAAGLAPVGDRFVEGSASVNRLGLTPARLPVIDPTFTAIPEPGIFALLALGLLGLVFATRAHDLPLRWRA